MPPGLSAIVNFRWHSSAQRCGDTYELLAPFSTSPGLRVLARNRGGDVFVIDIDASSRLLSSAELYSEPFGSSLRLSAQEGASSGRHRGFEPSSPNGTNILRHIGRRGKWVNLLVGLFGLPF